MQQVFVIFSKSVDQIAENYKKIQTVIILLVVFDFADSFITNQVLPILTIDIVASLYQLTSMLIAFYLALVLYIKLCEIAFNKKFKLTKKLYLKYIWANVLIMAGFFTGLIFLVIPGIIWLVLNTFTQTIVVVENLSVKKSIVKAVNLAKKHFKVTLNLTVFMFITFIPVLGNIGYIFYRYYSGEYVFNNFSIWQVFITFYALFMGTILSMVTINLYKKIAIKTA